MYFKLKHLQKHIQVSKAPQRVLQIQPLETNYLVERLHGVIREVHTTFRKSTNPLGVHLALTGATDSCQVHLSASDVLLLDEVYP